MIWLSGEFVEEDAARIAPLDRGFLLGDGVFDTFAIRDGAPAHFAAHMARLRAAADAFGIPVPFSDAEADSAARRVAEASGVVTGAGRLTLSRGQGPRGLVPPDPASPTVMLGAAPSPPPPESVAVFVSDVARASVALSSRHKTLSYIDNVEARRRAAARGFDEALMLNERGEIACASAANIFWFEGDALCTPALDCGVLAGVTRARVLDIARAEGWAAREGRFGLDALAGADCAFLTNSVLGAVPIRAVEGRDVTRDFGAGDPRLVTLRATLG